MKTNYISDIIIFFLHWILYSLLLLTFLLSKGESNWVRVLLCILYPIPISLLTMLQKTTVCLTKAILWSTFKFKVFEPCNFYEKSYLFFGESGFVYYKSKNLSSIKFGNQTYSQISNEEIGLRIGRELYDNEVYTFAVNGVKFSLLKEKREDIKFGSWRYTLKCKGKKSEITLYQNEINLFESNFWTWVDSGCYIVSKLERNLHILEFEKILTKLSTKNLKYIEKFKYISMGVNIKYDVKVTIFLSCSIILFITELILQILQMVPGVKKSKYYFFFLLSVLLFLFTSSWIFYTENKITKKTLLKSLRKDRDRRHKQSCVNNTLPELYNLNSEDIWCNIFSDTRVKNPDIVYCLKDQRCNYIENKYENRELIDINITPTFKSGVKSFNLGNGIVCCIEVLNMKLNLLNVKINFTRFSKNIIKKSFQVTDNQLSRLIEVLNIMEISNFVQDSDKRTNNFIHCTRIEDIIEFCFNSNENIFKFSGIKEGVKSFFIGLEIEIDDSDELILNTIKLKLGESADKFLYHNFLFFNGMNYQALEDVFMTKIVIKGKNRCYKNSQFKKYSFDCLNLFSELGFRKVLFGVPKLKNCSQAFYKAMEKEEVLNFKNKREIIKIDNLKIDRGNIETILTANTECPIPEIKVNNEIVKVNPYIDDLFKKRLQIGSANDQLNILDIACQDAKLIFNIDINYIKFNAEETSNKKRNEINKKNRDRAEELEKKKKELLNKKEKIENKIKNKKKSSCLNDHADINDIVNECNKLDNILNNLNKPFEFETPELTKLNCFKKQVCSGANLKLLPDLWEIIENKNVYKKIKEIKGKLNVGFKGSYDKKIINSVKQSLELFKMNRRPGPVENFYLYNLISWEGDETLDNNVRYVVNKNFLEIKKSPYLKEVKGKRKKKMKNNNNNKKNKGKGKKIVLKSIPTMSSRSDRIMSGLCKCLLSKNKSIIEGLIAYLKNKNLSVFKKICREGDLRFSQRRALNLLQWKCEKSLFGMSLYKSRKEGESNVPSYFMIN